MAAKGCHAVSFSENPSKLKLPSFHSDHWDPFWTACSDEGTIVCLHIGSSSSLVMTAPDAPIDVLLAPPAREHHAGGSRSVVVAGAAQVPRFDDRPVRRGDRLDPLLLRADGLDLPTPARWTGQDWLAVCPSEVFRERIVTCFIDDPVGVTLRHRVGLDNVCWEADYPHSDSTWPVSPRPCGSPWTGCPIPRSTR